MPRIPSSGCAPTHNAVCDFNRLLRKPVVQESLARLRHHCGRFSKRCGTLLQICERQDSLERISIGGVGGEVKFPSSGLNGQEENGIPFFREAENRRERVRVEIKWHLKPRRLKADSLILEPWPRWPVSLHPAFAKAPLPHAGTSLRSRCAAPRPAPTRVPRPDYRLQFSST